MHMSQLITNLGTGGRRKGKKVWDRRFKPKVRLSAHHMAPIAHKKQIQNSFVSKVYRLDDCAPDLHDVRGGERR